MAESPRANAPASRSVVISIDFEMRWGVPDIHQLDFNAYRRNLENSRPAVQASLAMLAERNLRATWATVGALGARNWEEYWSLAPQMPAYGDPRLAVRKEYAGLDRAGRLHFAPDLVAAIARTPGQELGSHSFSHLYFREPGIRPEDFVADLKAVENLWRERFGVTPVSLVYPRNQSAFTDLLGATSIKTWRGPEPAWFYDRNTRRDNTTLARMLRLLDGVVPLFRRASRPEGRMLRAGMFVRFGLPEALWRLHLAKIGYELRRLGPGESLHLWWHPHNLGSDLPVGLKRLRQVLDRLSGACSAGGVASKSMGDFVF